MFNHVAAACAFPLHTCPPVHLSTCPPVLFSAYIEKSLMTKDTTQILEGKMPSCVFTSTGGGSELSWAQTAALFACSMHGSVFAGGLAVGRET